MVHTFNPSTWEAEAQISVQGQTGLQSEFQDSQGFKKESRFKKIKWEQLYKVVYIIDSFVISFLLLLFGWFLVFQDRISLCSLDFPRTCSVDQVGLKPTEI